MIFSYIFLHAFSILFNGGKSFSTAFHLNFMMIGVSEFVNK